MDMHRPEFGDYQMRNEVVEYEAGRRLVWEPARVAAWPRTAGRPPTRAGTGGDSSSPPKAPGHHGHRDLRLQPVPEDLREAVREGEGWRDAMTASLVKLELLARALGAV